MPAVDRHEAMLEDPVRHSAAAQWASRRAELRERHRYSSVISSEALRPQPLLLAQRTP
jgi:hypothetical protein